MAVELGKGCLLVLPERVYVAGLKLGKTFRRREAEKRAQKASAEAGRGGELREDR